ncbi:AAA family ATPase [Rhodocytophaga rosea]|uniref:AAA family ATPase n=1 Tax=Rhodocytophaga rosea TaxID=2704465 RepID=A0A6C0GLS2_9BACT|nr:AAA family ATPase [Rhodocytophaga rosea]QHT68975.1 AAA family ATPase [Rhodocytophaga rosea]
MSFQHVTVPIPVDYAPVREVKRVIPEPVNKTHEGTVNTSRIGEIELKKAVDSVLKTDINKEVNLNKWSFIIGMYVGAKAIEYQTAYDRLCDAIDQKDCEDYEAAHATVEDALNDGMKAPIDLAKKEKERQEWLDKNYINWSEKRNKKNEQQPENKPDTEESFISTGEAILSRGIQEIPTLVDPIFPQVGLVALAGSSDTGKSSWLRQFAIAISLGDSFFLAWKLNLVHFSAIYVSTEDDELAVNFLLNKQTRSRGLPPNRYKNLRFLFDTTSLLEKLDKELTRQPADCVIIDAFTDLYSGSLNQTNEVRTFLNKYKLLSDKHKCLIIVLHHTGKKTEDLEPSKHNLLGSQGFEAKMRLVIELRTDANQDDLRHLCLVKGNYLSREYKQASYVLRFDENMLFHSTQERTPFEQLSKAEAEKEGQEDERMKKILKAIELRNNGYTMQGIADELDVQKGTISKWLSKYS